MIKSDITYLNKQRCGFKTSVFCWVKAGITSEAWRVCLLQPTFGGLEAETNPPASRPVFLLG